MYVLDRHLQPVPVGVAGEIFIGGRNLARGYLGRPELTAEKFIAHPFDRTPGARVYRTGDLGRYREDGAIEYLGRLDHQVKLRGFRIELGEIEEALASHPAVGAAVVVAREVAPGDTRLVAYVAGDHVPGASVGRGLVPRRGRIAAGEGEPKTGELIAFLKERLPEYMVPSAFVHLPELPLSPNGKVDRKALPDPELSRPELATPYVAPREGLERAIAEVWSRLLGIERVGVHDNFFDLGGHSLLMAELRTSLQAKVGRTLSMVELFQYPTVKALAEFLERPAGTAPDALLEARDRVESRRQAQARRQQAAAARRARPRSEG
jgi:hypothetical protein